jgi:hypothetical protein
MADYVFINPSPNMEEVAKSVYNNGCTTEIIYTKDYVRFVPEAVWAMMGGKATRLGTTRMPADVYTAVCNMKKPFFSRFQRSFVKERLAAIHPDVQGGTLQDYVLLTSPFYSGADMPFSLSEYSFDQIVERNGSSYIITSSYPTGGGKYSMSHWRTDFDMRDALGKGYFFFFDGRARHEIFCRDNEFIYITEGKNKLDWLKKMNPTLSRFAFEKLSSTNFNQNTNAWIQHCGSRVFLINDYSWQGISVKMPENWARSVAKYLCIDKKK